MGCSSIDPDKFTNRICAVGKAGEQLRETMIALLTVSRKRRILSAMLAILRCVLLIRGVIVGNVVICIL